jgi:hypothetical protein
MSCWYSCPTQKLHRAQISRFDARMPKELYVRIQTSLDADEENLSS